jgi:PIN domain nuclease of toxin-antitoxin system
VAAEAYVVDTHALVWRAAGLRRRFGDRSHDVFERFDAGAVTLYVPAVVLAEIASLERRGGLRMRSSFRRWWNELETAGAVGIPLEIDDVLRARELDWSHREMSDRVIVASALRLDLPLLTADRAIAEWGGVEVIW